jgi:hypothetical protein
LFKIGSIENVTADEIVFALMEAMHFMNINLISVDSRVMVVKVDNYDSASIARRIERVKTGQEIPV